MTTMTQRVGWQKISANLVRHFLLDIYFTMVIHIYCYFMFIDSVIQIGFCIFYPSYTSEGRNAAYRDTEFYTHDCLFLSLYIFYMPPYKLFSTARWHSIKYIFYTTGYILPLQFYTCLSNFMFHRSTPVLIFLRLTFQYKYKSFLLHAIYGMQLSYSSKFRVAVSGGGERTSHVADS
jgi:hypothetical protein